MKWTRLFKEDMFREECRGQDPRNCYNLNGKPKRVKWKSRQKKLSNNDIQERRMGEKV